MSKHSLTWVAIFLLITTMFLKIPPMVAKQDAVFNTYSALVEVDALARQKFVEPIQDDSLVHGAIRGMIRQLDAYSGYVAPDELAAFERRSLGHYFGIGVEIGLRDGRLTVVAPIEGGPAAEAGVLAGDYVLSVDGQDTEGHSVFDMEELLAGPAGTSVILTVQQPQPAGQVTPPSSRTMTIPRRDINLTTIRGFSRKNNGDWSFFADRKNRIGYLRISNFLGTTATDFAIVLDEVLKNGANGLIIDLRFNPGGIMHEAIAIVDLFVSEGVIVSTVNRRRATQEYRATSITPAPHLPLVVLVNHASASASEILAGALQDHQRAIVIGERTFGKGCVQHLIHLTEQRAAVSLTTAHYRLPNGQMIHRTPQNTDSPDWGVTPDHQIFIDDAELEKVRNSRKSLELANSDPSQDSDVAQSGFRDRQLAEAIELLIQDGR